MRRVFTPPERSEGWLLPLAGGVVVSALVFLVLPLSQLASSSASRQLQLLPAEVTAAPPPPPEIEPPPPPREEPPEPPPPRLNQQPQQLSLSDLDLDIDVGMGGLMPGGFEGLVAGEDSSSGLDVFDVSDLDQEPVLVSSPAPRYPPDLRRDRVEGTVVLTFLLAEDGRVSDARVASSTHPAFEKPALDAVRRWRFRPGTKAGEPVQTHMRLPIRFTIRN